MSPVIYERDSLKIRSICSGPDDGGHCPRPQDDGRAYCAGLDVVLTKDEGGAYGSLDRTRLAVCGESVVCPLADLAECHREYFSPFAQRSTSVGP
jgi:hypothetical protein